MNPQFELELVKALTNILNIPNLDEDIEFNSRKILKRIVDSWEKSSLQAYSGIIN